MRQARAGLPLTVLLLMSGCGGAEEGADGEPGSDAAAARPNACELLTADEVGRAFGTGFNQGHLEEYGTEPDESYFSTCVFEAANEMAIPTVSLSVRPSPDVTDPAAALQAHADDMRANLGSDHVTETVPGFAGAAGWDEAMTQLTVYQPGLMLTAGSVGGEEPKAALIELARTALERVGN